MAVPPAWIRGGFGAPVAFARRAAAAAGAGAGLEWRGARGGAPKGRPAQSSRAARSAAPAGPTAVLAAPRASGGRPSTQW